IALLPELALAPVAARVAAGEASAAARGGGVALVLLLAGGLLLGSPRVARAAVDPEFVRSESAWFGKNLKCMCGMSADGCGHMLEDCGAECGAAPMFRKQIVEMLESGQTRDRKS